jgi:hypothetical protein
MAKAMPSLRKNPISSASSAVCILFNPAWTASHPQVQVIVATHSPIILSYPGEQIVSFDGRKLKEITYEQTTPYQVVSGFLRNPELYLRKLLEDEQGRLWKEKSAKG